jgi:hypothetical protein
MIDPTLLTNPGVQIISILVGIAVLIAGRKLFWLFVGVVGFAVGLSLAFQLLTDQPTWLILVAALILGIVGAVVAIFVQTAAIGVAGFLVGGYVVLWLLQQLGLDVSQWGWIVFIIGGILGVILALLLFDAALIILSSLTGASLIVQVTNLSPLVMTLLFIVLVVIGIVIQTTTGRARRTDHETTNKRMKTEG